MDKRAEISEFLRTRRARITPEQANLPDYGGKRRVPGLRREEVATLAEVQHLFDLARAASPSRLGPSHRRGSRHPPRLRHPQPPRPRPHRPDRRISHPQYRIRTLWAAHNVRHHRTGRKLIHHPVVGDLGLTYEAMELPAEPGLTMFAFTPDPASDTEERLKLLASWAATLTDIDRINQTPVPREH